MWVYMWLYRRIGGGEEKRRRSSGSLRFAHASFLIFLCLYKLCCLRIKKRFLSRIGNNNNSIVELFIIV